MISEDTCSICANTGEFARKSIVLGSHRADYMRCTSCGYLWIANPEWLEEAYSSAIAAMDTGIMARNLNARKTLVALLGRYFDRGDRFLDAGGGHGTLVRLMRDEGFDFRWSDGFASNLFARGFEDDGGRYSAITAIELVEHLRDPFGFISGEIGRTSADTFIFTTELYDSIAGSSGLPPDDWWYYAYESGQHIGFFQERTLNTMGERLGMRVVSAGALHMLTTRVRPSQQEFSLVLRPLIRQALAVRARRQRISLTWADHLALRDHPPVD